MSFSVLLHALALVLLVSKTDSFVDELKTDEFKGNLRLPKFAVPRSYTIRLRPDLEASRFIGSVEIRVEIISSTRYLVLNVAELKLTLSSVQYTISNSSQVWLPAKIDIVSQDQIVVLAFPSFLPKGYILAMEFGGVFNDLLTGFYRSKNGANKFMAVTQFEPISARRCFPCWDEPTFKDTFKTMLKLPSQLVAVSNMPVIDEKVDGDMKTVSYQESPHELGHQWLGKLVTMDWWSDLWLNEGFATWLSYIAVEKLHPELDAWTIFIENELTLAFNMDSAEGSSPFRPIGEIGISFFRIFFHADVNQTMDIDNMFNPITYNKGEAVVRMLEKYIGPETLQRSYAAYVRRYAWSNVKTTDQWVVLKEVSGLAISRVFSSFDRNPNSTKFT